ncbi:MAG: BamA/TamA family outer membrane protein [Gemmatimonadota bacterium]
MSFRGLVPFLAALLSAPALAQTPVRPAAPEPCAAGRISYVFVDNASIFDLSEEDLDRRFLWAYRTANRLHRRTKESMIRRELLFEPGSCYDPFMLSETERLLRSYRFLSTVDVFGVPQTDGTHHVIVDTRDEWSTRVDVSVRTSGGFGIEGMRLTEDNLLGTGQSLGLFYFEREVTRDYGVSYHTPQLFGTRWDVTGALGRSRAGTFVHEEVAYPFVAEVSRWAGRQTFRRDDQFFEYILDAGDAGDRPRLLLPMREQAFDLSVLRRIGRRGNMALVGAALSYQELSYPGELQLAERDAFDERVPAGDSLAAVVAPQREVLDNIRAYALLGHRNVWWVRRRGLDSMRGQEDIRLGAEAILALGRSMPSIETDDDLYSMLNLYAGFDIGDVLVIGRARGDSRRDLTASALQPEWEDVYADGDVLAYLQTPALPRQTLFFRAAATGAWNSRTPFQLTLGGDYGMRGYARDELPGGRRVVLTLEDRFFIGWPLPDVLDLGGSVFADAGRVWPGDVPFGTDSGWRTAAGIGLRGSFPAGSRSIYRIDIAWPIQAGTRFGDFRVSVSLGEIRGHNPREPDKQLIRSRTQNIGGDLFTFRR